MKSNDSQQPAALAQNDHPLRFSLVVPLYSTARPGHAADHAAACARGAGLRKPLHQRRTSGATRRLHRAAPRTRPRSLPRQPRRRNRNPPRTRPARRPPDARNQDRRTQRRPSSSLAKTSPTTSKSHPPAPSSARPIRSASCTACRHFCNSCTPRRKASPSTPSPSTTSRASLARTHARRRPPLHAARYRAPDHRRHGRRQAQRLPLAPLRRPGLPRREQDLSPAPGKRLRRPLLHPGRDPRHHRLCARPRHPRRSRVRYARPRHRLVRRLSRSRQRPGPLPDRAHTGASSIPPWIPPAKAPTNSSTASSAR